MQIFNLLGHYLCILNAGYVAIFALTWQRFSVLCVRSGLVLHSHRAHMPRHEIRIDVSHVLTANNLKI